MTQMYELRVVLFFATVASDGDVPDATVQGGGSGTLPFKEG
jgi:hypothetical protein